MAVPFEFEDFEGKRDIDRSVFVLAVLRLVRFIQRFLALADKNQNVILARLDDLKPKENIAQGHRPMQPQRPWALPPGRE